MSRLTIMPQRWVDACFSRAGGVFNEALKITPLLYPPRPPPPRFPYPPRLSLFAREACSPP